MLQRMFVPTLVWLTMLAIVLGVLTIFLMMIYQQATHPVHWWAGAFFYVLCTYSAVMLTWTELRKRYQATATRLYYLKLFDNAYPK